MRHKEALKLYMKHLLASCMVRWNFEAAEGGQDFKSLQQEGIEFMHSFVQSQGNNLKVAVM